MIGKERKTAAIFGMVIIQTGMMVFAMTIYDTSARRIPSRLAQLVLLIQYRSQGHLAAIQIVATVFVKVALAPP